MIVDSAKQRPQCEPRNDPKILISLGQESFDPGAMESH
jgi:hypothetical protein